jgi:dihydroorotate dehydrogenase electron transfer subunit
MIETIATVDANIEIVPGYRLLTVSFNQDIKVRPGQFAMLRAHSCYEPLLRRALAVYQVPGPRQLAFLYHILGRGTEMLSLLDRGSKIDALLPLGNSWPLEQLPLRGRALVVAGGIGSASLLLLCEELARGGVDTHIYFGAASEQAAIGCGLEHFRALGLPMTITTDDGSLGERGFVTQPLERHITERTEADSIICACGPWVMMSRVAEIADRFDSRCLVSLEAPMGCGFGVCVGCVVAVKAEAPGSYGSYKRVCTDGSIFPAEVIRWEVNAMT